MLYGLTLPKYDEVKALEGTGPFAVSKYYKFPWNIFYCFKLWMIVQDLPKKKTKNILDFGAGRAKIFHEELQKHAERVLSVEKKEELDLRWRFDVVVCASSLEFMYLKTALAAIKCVIHDKGTLIVASPMDTWLTRLYFKLIGDTYTRNTHNDIIEAVQKYFTIEKCRRWMGLYFCLKAVPK